MNHRLEHAWTLVVLVHEHKRKPHGNALRTVEGIGIGVANAEDIANARPRLLVQRQIR